MFVIFVSCFAAAGTCVHDELFLLEISIHLQLDCAVCVPPRSKGLKAAEFSLPRIGGCEILETDEILALT